MQHWVGTVMQYGKCISGTLVEKSTYASSYRGELLGLLAIRLFLLAVEEYYGVTTDGSDLVCDNKAALYFQEGVKTNPIYPSQHRYPEGTALYQG